MVSSVLVVLAGICSPILVYLYVDFGDELPRMYFVFHCVFYVGLPGFAGGMVLNGLIDSKRDIACVAIALLSWAVTSPFTASAIAKFGHFP